MMAGGRRDGLEFVYINSSYLAILEDEAWDRITSAETNAGKKRREIENIIVQANIELYEYIVLSSIRHFLDKIKEKNNDLAKELAHKNKSDEITRIYHEYHLWEAKRLELIKTLEKIKDILLEKINQSNMLIFKLDKQINEKSVEIEKLDERYDELNSKMKNIYIKSYDTFLSQPIPLLPCADIITALIAELNLPDDHPLRNAPEIPDIDIKPIVIEIKEDIKDPNFDMIHIEQHNRDIIKKYLGNQTKEYLKPLTSSEEYIDIVNKAANSPEFEKKVDQVLVVLNKNISDNDRKQLDENQAEQIKNRQEKNIKVAEKSHLETERDNEYLKKESNEKKRGLVNSMCGIAINQQSLVLDLEDDLLSILESAEDKLITSHPEPPHSKFSLGLFPPAVKQGDYTKPSDKDKPDQRDADKPTNNNLSSNKK